MTSQGAPEAGAWKTVPVEPALPDEMIHRFAIAAKMGDGCFESHDPSVHRALQSSKQRVADGLRAAFATDALAKAVHREMMAELFMACQPDKGDIFAFMDDRIDVVRASLHRALAASPSPPTGVGEVVQLEWNEEEHEPNWWTAWHADARLGYEVRATHRGKVRRRIIGENWTDFDGDIDEAKSAAQADFERRIRSALVPSSLLKEAEEPLRTALVAMTLAKALPGVADEYDFEPAIAEVTAALARLGAAP